MSRAVASSDIRPRIVFLSGEASRIDRSWDYSDVEKTLSAIGYQTAHYSFSDEVLAVLREESRYGQVIIWPTAYTIGQDPQSRQISDALLAQGIPYVGAQPRTVQATSKIQLDKILRTLGLSTPKSWVIPYSATIDRSAVRMIARGIDQEVGMYPLVVKCEYSTNSLGVSAVHNLDDLIATIMHQLGAYGQDIIVQQWCREREFTCAILSYKSCIFVAPIEIILDNAETILDESVKHSYRGLRLEPVEDVDLSRRLCSMVSSFWQSTGGGDYARIDVLQDREGNLHIIDVNLLPAQDEGPPIVSFFPRAFAINYGLTYRECVLAILASAISRSPIALPADVAAAGRRLSEPGTAYKNS